MPTPSSITPNTAFTVLIHAPALGSSLPADTPATISGTPMPIPSANKATPPSTGSPVCPM